MRALVIAALVTLTTPALATPGFIAVPPMEVEVGAGTPVAEATPAANTTELRVGIHTASLYWKQTRFDVGIGYAASYRTLPMESAAFAYGGGFERQLTLHGLYFAFNYAIESHRHWRTWVGGRIEGLGGDRYQDRSLEVIGGAVRLSAEIYAAGTGAAGDNKVVAFMAGAWALGVYVEGTARTLPTELGPVGVGAGMTMRIPFLLAAGS